MSRIDFAFGAPDRLRMACEVVRKHYVSGRPLLVYTQDTQRLARFDRLLWGFDAQAFVPHVQADDPLAGQTPVLLTASPPSPMPAANGLQAWLINLDLPCPPGAETFERVLEIVYGHEDAKNSEARRVGEGGDRTCRYRWS